MWERHSIRKSADEAWLGRAQQRSLLEASLDALVIIGPDAKIADVNSALETITGRSRTELIGSDPARYFTDPEQARRLYRDVLRDEAVRDRPLELRHRDGHVTSVSCSASAYRDGAGAMIGVVAAARPISTFVGEPVHVGTDPRLRQAANVVLDSATVLAVGIGTLGLVGWAPQALGRVAGALPSPAAGACFVAAALACRLLGASPKPPFGAWTRLAARALAAAVVAAALYALSARLRGSPAPSSLLGVSIALPFSLYGIAMLGIDWTIELRSRRYWPAHAFTFMAGMIAIAGLLDAVLGSSEPLTELGLPSAVGLFSLALGMVCARLDYGLGALLTSASLGGMLTRWLWPSAVVGPMLLGMATHHAVLAGLLGEAGVLTPLILSMVSLLGTLVIWNGHRVDRSDRLRQSTQDALRRREQELHEAHRLARVGSWRWDLDDDRVTWSPELYRITGHDPALPPLTFEELMRHQTVESSTGFRAALDAARSTGAPFETELIVVRPDGARRFATARGEADRDSVGRIALLRGTVEDITERKIAQAELARVHRAQRASSRCNQVLVRATDEATLLRQVCEIIIENTDYRCCWVGHAKDDAAKTVEQVARAGVDDGYLTAATFTWAEDGIDRDGVGECIRTAKTVLIGDIQRDPRAASWRERALAHGYGSVVAIPLQVDGKTFGALTIYASEPEAFGSRELALLGELADDLAFGLTALHTRAAHDRAEAQIRRLNAELEQRVQSRTAELRAANELKDVLLLHQQATATELERAREREADLGFRIQQTLLLDPPPSDVPGLTVAANTLPSQRVDGDFYAFINHQDQVLDVIIGDVMGKGILAALLGAATKAHILKALGDLAGSGAPRALPRPKDIVMLAHAGVARHLIELESFVTLCYARFDMLERRLDFVDCGHTGIILASAETGETRLLQGSNLPLGVREGELYEQISVPLAPGDTLLLFSDGITDARGDTRQSFGLERLVALVKEHGALEPRELIAAIGSAVSTFSSRARPSDDQTSVALHVETTRLPLLHAELEIQSDLAELGRVRDFVRSFCHGVPGTPLDDDAIAELELAANEAASNIMKHAYSGDRDQLIRIEGDAFADRVAVRLRHLGSPFSPDAAPAPQFNGSRESGFGAYMIASSVDEVKYYRDASGRNCVALFKKPRARRAPQEQHTWS
jgi:phosphoserine phosphatase RsbU/P